MGALRLAVPARTPNPGAAAFLNPARLKAWLEALPLGSPVKTCEELLKVLQLVNRAEATAQQRYQFLDQCRPLIADLLETQYKQYATAAVPLAEKQQACADLTHSLLGEMASGYKIVILSSTETARGDAHNTLVASALYAMHHLARLLVDIYSLYAPEPRNLWLELHQLYSLAEQQGFLTATLQQEGKDSGVRSVEHAYRRILMLALANPYHLMQGEALLVFRELDNWAGTCRLSPLAPGASPKGHLYLDLEKDAAPRYAPTSLKVATPHNGRIIDISAVMPIIEQRIRELLTSSKTESGQLNLAGRKLRNMYKRLADAWGVRVERLSERRRKSSPVEIVVGVSACHHFAGETGDFNPEISEIELRKGKSAGQGHDGLSLMSEGETPWLHEDQVQRINTGIIQPRTSQFTTEKEADKDIWVKVYSTQVEHSQKRVESSTTGFASLTCQMHEESRGGMALSCKKTQGLRLTAGEVIGFRSDQSPDSGDWSIGVVRWLRASPPDKLELGIRALADDTLPVATRGVKGVGKDSEYFRSLLIPKMDPLEYPTTLITPASVYDVDSVVLVNTGTQLFYAKLLKLADATNAYSLFQFQVVAGP
jgi:hypothetical protein